MAIFECEVCNEDYSNLDESRAPRVLKCGHSICQNCAVKLISNSVILCPKKCSETTEVQNGNVESLQKNFGLMQAMEMMEASSSNSPPKCKEHRYNIAEFLCSEHDCPSIDKLMCRTCEEFGVHTGHTKVLMSVEAGKIRDVLECRLKQMKLNAESFTVQLEEFREAMSNRQLFIEKLSEIKYHFSRIRQLVDEREKRITDKLTFNTTEIYKCNKETESNMKRLQDCLLEKIEQTTKFSKISDYQLLQADIDLGGLTWYHSPITQKFSPADTKTMDVKLPAFKFVVKKQQKFE
ncbi:RING-type domain-containing protein [Caenorhabditis elegans]|uniref:RING-type domain-containing protein n=1 Tax=Caenorhabditis elegans TaxID=6239 RepID=O16683_CAEEL|nr:RING-type domain-containing protein [Caenorhabditis elegans]CCD61648.1 RING-type domain-containing protein [Caenorhabditis elegans]|eukprot:NP_494242.1 Uncharacterized protein CELE_ZK1240.8 [Caenorhabditis elegans]